METTIFEKTPVRHAPLVDAVRSPTLPDVKSITTKKRSQRHQTHYHHRLVTRPLLGAHHLLQANPFPRSICIHHLPTEPPPRSWSCHSIRGRSPGADAGDTTAQKRSSRSGLAHSHPPCGQG